ncbi:hypothetical protein GCM10011506_31160 [Marivirga lumbricoides]|uniref:Uncharacterized protein n=1 Tax=Marivirga lumbricoides TaxID=1046115 RepID=A0ABQ1MMY0_9BACT|nr:hypothetical protein GCM10011506_31160 [Marivirga lumbricoides]
MHSVKIYYNPSFLVIKNTLIQVERIIKVRNIEIENLQDLVYEYTGKPLVVISEPSDRINTLKINLLQTN